MYKDGFGKIKTACIENFPLHQLTEPGSKMSKSLNFCDILDLHN